MSEGPLKVALVGAGHRGVGYSSFALRNPERMKMVAVADPRENRRNEFGQQHGIPPEMRFASHKELLARPKIADAVINATMDQDHYATALPLLEAGYHMLLEKPISPTENEVRGLITAAKDKNLKVMICHVLRYAPFYSRIKEVLVSGEVGDIVSMRTSENVSYHHMAVGYIRGKWSRLDRSTPMLLAKCCHDLDIIAWLMSGISPRRVSSFGGLFQFKPENAPKGSAKRCLDGCAIESSCPYSARANYIEADHWKFYSWEDAENLGEMTRNQKLDHMKNKSPFGRCVWHCDNDVVDHQSVLVEFANGATATHDMFTATSRPTRLIHIIGTRGEIEGDLEAGKIIVRKPAPRGNVLGFDERTEDVLVKGDSHGGGDAKLVADFVSVVRGEEASLGATRIEDSLNGHLLAFGSDVAMNEGRVVVIKG